jgi:hypothetical protein
VDDSERKSCVEDVSNNVVSQGSIANTLNNDDAFQIQITTNWHGSMDFAEFFCGNPFDNNMIN